MMMIMSVPANTSNRTVRCEGPSQKTELYAVVMGWFWGEVSIPESVDGGHGGRGMVGVVDRRRDLRTWESKVQDLVQCWINVRNVESCPDGNRHSGNCAFLENLTSNTPLCESCWLFFHQNCFYFRPAVALKTVELWYHLMLLVVWLV